MKEVRKERGWTEGREGGKKDGRKVRSLFGNGSRKY